MIDEIGNAPGEDVGNHTFSLRWYGCENFYNSCVMGRPEYSDDDGPMFTTIDQGFAELSNRLLHRTRNRELSLGISLGECRETFHFIAGAMSRIAKSYRLLKRGHIVRSLQTLTGMKSTKLRDIIQGASSAWLAYVYGLKPLVNDVSDMVRVLDKGLRTSEGLLSARVSFSVPVDASMSRTYDSGEHFTKRALGSVIFTGRLWYKIDNPTLYTLEQVGLINPAEVLWELIPFSFVVDWFVPVTNYLVNILPPQGVRFVDGYLYAKGRGKWIHNHFYPTFGSRRNLSLSAEVDTTFKVRRVLNGFPTYQVRVPDLSLSKDKVISALALLVQAARR